MSDDTLPPEDENDAIPPFVSLVPPLNTTPSEEPETEVQSFFDDDLDQSPNFVAEGDFDVEEMTEDGPSPFPIPIELGTFHGVVDNDDAIDNLNSLGSANTTLDAPDLCRNCVSSTPVGPAPKTTTEHPAMGSSRSIRCAMQAEGSAKTARSRSMLVASNNCTPGTRTYSAKPPGVDDPIPANDSHSHGRSSVQ